MFPAGADKTIHVTMTMLGSHKIISLDNLAYYFLYGDTFFLVNDQDKAFWFKRATETVRFLQDSSVVFFVLC